MITRPRKLPRSFIRPRLAVLGAMCLAAVNSAPAQSPNTAQARAAAQALKEVQATDGPDKVYDAYSRFAQTHFGAQTDPLFYQVLGEELALLEDGAWEHISENSTTIALETNLPAQSYIEYGPTQRYGSRTEPTDRHYFLHIHQLAGLETGQTYHFRLVATDERGNRIVTPDQTITTSRIDNAIHLPIEGQQPPYELDRSGATYVLTGDITTKGAAIITLRDDITVDLNGHTITFGQGATDGDDVAGIIGRGSQRDSQLRHQATNLRIVNGTVRQGEGPAMRDNEAPDQLNPIVIAGQDIELAGLNIIYHAPQAWGVVLNHGRGDIRIHHNRFKDMGAKVVSRGGAGVRPIGFRHTRDRPNSFVIHHNLVQRTRQNGLSRAHRMHNNEVHVDSWSTNSFAMQPDSAPSIPAGEHHHNRIFATGFNPYGFGWAHEDLNIHNNVIQMHGLDLKHRWHESWGDVNLLAAFRVTNYGKGGQVRNNLSYQDNLVIMRGQGGANIQGTRFFSDESIEGITFTGNTVKTERLDNIPARHSGCIVAHGHFRKDGSNPVFYRENTLISNHVIVQFGEAYAKGNNHRFESTRFVRTGNRRDFATFRFGGAFYNRDHEVVDGTFAGGAAPDDVFWDKTGSLSTYAVKWTLSLSATPGAPVRITDAHGETVFNGRADRDGQVQVALTQYDVRPGEWDAEDPENMTGVDAKRENQKVAATPHTITVGTGGNQVTREIEITEPTELDLR